MNKPLENFKITGTKKCVSIIEAPSRKFLIDTIIWAYKEIHGKPYDKKLLFLVLISKKCGCVKGYKTVKDIPRKSVKCKHGISFIKYE